MDSRRGELAQRGRTDRSEARRRILAAAAERLEERAWQEVSPASGGGAARPQPKPAPDRTAPRVAGVSLTAKRLDFRLSEGARVAATIQKRVVRRVRRGKRVRKVTTWSVVRRVRASATGKATLRIPLNGRRLGRGSYRVTVQATDPAGNPSKKMVVTRTVR
jgi:hypothetical protein